MRYSQAGEASGIGFEHRLDIVAAVRALLQQTAADGSEIEVAEHFSQRGTLGGVTFCVRRGDYTRRRCRVRGDRGADRRGRHSSTTGKRSHRRPCVREPVELGMRRRAEQRDGGSARFRALRRATPAA